MKKRIIRNFIIVLILVLAGLAVSHFTDGSAGSDSSSPSQSQSESVDSGKTKANNTQLTSGDKSSERKTIYTFRDAESREEHFNKHGSAFSYKTAEEYEAGASSVITNPNALHKTEKEDGDDVYYIEETNEIVFASKAGVIRTYFKPDDGIDYYNRQ